MNYLAPEILVLPSDKTSAYTKAVDCWSVGVVLFVLVTARFPFGTEEEAGFINRVIDGHLDFDPDEWEGRQDAADLCKRLLNVDPDKRASIEDALNSRWISNQKELLEKLWSKMADSA